jgi:hypothetical protein
MCDGSIRSPGANLLGSHHVFLNPAWASAQAGDVVPRLAQQETDADLEKFKTAVGGDVTLNVAELRYKVEIARMAADMRKDDREHWFTAWMVPTAFAVLFTHVAAVRLGSFASFRRCADDFRSSLTSRPFKDR